MDYLGGNHKTLKLMNQESILGWLSKKPYSIGSLARKTGLSITGVTTIMKDLFKEGIVEKLESQGSDKVGRHAIRWRISDSSGIVAVVAFLKDCEINFYNLSGENLYSLNYVYPDKETRAERDVVEIATKMKECMQTRFADIPLFNVVVAVGGKIDKSGKLLYAPYFSDYQTLDLKAIFYNALNTQIIIKNDLKLSLYAEYQIGEYRKLIKNTLYLQIGMGVGSALFLNNELYEGNNGFSGEIGYFLVDYKTNVDNNYNIHRKYFYNYCSYERIKKVIENNISEGFETMLSKEDVTIEEIIDAYEKGDSLCVNVIEDVARVVARVLRSITEVLDIANVIISNKLFFFGDKFIKSVEKELNRNKKDGFIPLYLSSIVGESAAIGARLMGVAKAIEGLCAALNDTPKD